MYQSVTMQLFQLKVIAAKKKKKSKINVQLKKNINQKSILKISRKYGFYIRNETDFTMFCCLEEVMASVSIFNDFMFYSFL